MSYFSPLYTGSIQSVLLPTTLHRVDPGCLTSHHFTQGGSRVSYFPPLYTGWIRDVLLLTTLHRVDPECLTSHHFTQGGSGMSYFPPLYTGRTQSVLLPTTCHRVDLGCLTSHHFTQGGNKVPSSCCFSRSESTISYFTLLYTERTWKILLLTTSHRVDLKCLASECSTQNGP